jgi:DNA-binding transcriptional regulator YhcF (GntR family)
MLLTLDDDDPGPRYAQIASAVRRALATGGLAPGDRLPPARQLAASLGVNMHTVLRAYGELADEGLVAMRQGRGVTVVAAAPERARLHDMIRQLTAEGRRLGVDPETLAAMIREMG